jgi:hypothetical protein
MCCEKGAIMSDDELRSRLVTTYGFKLITTRKVWRRVWFEFAGEIEVGF